MASNNHISRPGIGGKGVAGKISDHWRSNCFLKVDTEGDRTRCAGCLFQYFTTRTEGHRSCAEDGLFLAVIGRCALVARLGADGGSSQTVEGQLHLLKC